MSHPFKKPRALSKGGMLAVVSPASAANEGKVRQGIAELENAGYRTKLFEHALARGPLYYAGTTAQRVGDLHLAFADPEVDAVICTRGGWGCAELLPFLDAQLIVGSGKAFLGYSDHTSMHVWLQSQGMVSFQAPMVAADWEKNLRGAEDGVDWASWEAALGGATDWSLGEKAGLRVLRAGTAEGVLTGGCLSIYAESLGTPFAALACGGILFLEDIAVKPYQWDRMLVHLRHAGMLEGVQGIVLGDMAQSCDAAELPLLESALLHALRDFAGPIAIGLRSGHVDAGNITLPFGVRVRLECVMGNPRMHFLEAATEG